MRARGSEATTSLSYILNPRPDRTGPWLMPLPME
jgi:hypothetical protein